MRWPWRKRKGPSWGARRQRELRKLEDLTDRLLMVLNINPGDWRRLVEERDQLKADLKEALLHQQEQADRIFHFERAICSHCGKAIYPQPPAPPSKSDPDYDAAMAHAELEDTLKTRR